MDSESSNPLLPVESSELLRNGIKMSLIFGYTSCEGNFFLRGKFFGGKYIFAFIFHYIHLYINRFDVQIFIKNRSSMIKIILMYNVITCFIGINKFLDLISTQHLNAHVEIVVICQCNCFVSK